MKVTWSGFAEQRAAEIFRYIATDNSRAADKWLGDLLERVSKLDRFPNRGRVVPEIGRPEYRELVVASYRVIYRVDPDRVLVLTVRHARRRWDEREAR